MRILEIDIETAPHKAYVWGLRDKYINPERIVEQGYTLCFAAKWYGEKEIIFRSIHEHGAKEMIRELWHLLDEADAVVHYNGSKFDIPTINLEFLLSGFSPPSPYHQIDLLRTMRQQFRAPSNKLDYIMQMLELGGKVAHAGMSMWKGCMEGNEKDWATMKKYNIGDIKLLEKLYDVLKPWIKNHPNVALYGDMKEKVCPTCGSTRLQSRGTYTTKLGVFKRYWCTDCGSWPKERFSTLTKEQKENILT